MFDTKKYYIQNRGTIRVKHRKYYLKNKEKIKSKQRDYTIDNPNYNRDYYQNNKERMSSQHMGYYLNNKTKTKVKCGEWRKNNPSYIKEWKSKNNYDNIYYKDNKDSIDKRHKNWEKDNPDKMRLLRRKGESKRRLKLKGFIFAKGITKQTQISVWNECKGCCVYCRRLTNPNSVNDILQTTYDHIIEVNHLDSKKHLYNPNGKSNMVISCRSCNSTRRDKPINKWCEEIGFVPELIKMKLEEQRQQTSLV